MRQGRFEVTPELLAKIKEFEVFVNWKIETPKDTDADTEVSEKEEVRRLPRGTAVQFQVFSSENTHQCCCNGRNSAQNSLGIPCSVPLVIVTTQDDTVNVLCQVSLLIKNTCPVSWHGYDLHGQPVGKWE